MPIHENVIRVGLIGCGHISTTYLRNIAVSEQLTVVACADRDLARAEQTAAVFGIPMTMTVEELLDREDIDLVLNLTTPEAHADITLRAIWAGKDVYCEKPIATSVSDAHKILRTAAALGRIVGVAPDTFMGQGMQTCKKLVDDGAIGRPIAVNASVMNAGPERFHPNPDFLFMPGAGPLMDIGPYYLTAMIELLGPITHSTGVAAAPREFRTVLTGDRAGSTFSVGTPTHVASVLEFDSGVVGTLVASFDVQDTQIPPFEIYGTEGTILAPRPNSWGGPVYLSGRGTDHFDEVALNFSDDFPDGPGYMGMGLVEMAQSLLAGRAPVADAVRATHVLEVLSEILNSAAAKRKPAIAAG